MENRTRDLTRLLVSVRNLVQVEEILKLDDKAKRL